MICYSTKTGTGCHCVADRWRCLSWLHMWFCWTDLCFIVTVVPCSLEDLLIIACWWNSNTGGIVRHWTALLVSVTVLFRLSWWYNIGFKTSSSTVGEYVRQDICRSCIERMYTFLNVLQFHIVHISNSCKMSVHFVYIRFCVGLCVQILSFVGCKKLTTACKQWHCQRWKARYEYPCCLFVYAKAYYFYHIYALASTCPVICKVYGTWWLFLCFIV